MTNSARTYVTQPPTQELISEKIDWIYGCGLYRYYVPAQDQGRVEFPWGRISGLFTPNPKDSQSDYIPLDFDIKEIEALYTVMQQLAKNKEPKYHLHEELHGFEEHVSEIEADLTADELSQLTSSQLVAAILSSQAESDMPRLREMILVAENTSFTVEESKKLAPWLLGFANKYRDSNELQDESAVLSAIRTGASMLHPRDIECLRPLLNPKHRIDTSLVTVKMLGRIFEAQPPADLNEHSSLADEVCDIAESSLHPHVITVNRVAAKAQLSIYALSAMANTKSKNLVKQVQQLGLSWFTQQISRELLELREVWINRQVSEKPRKLLDKIIQILD